MLFSLSADAEEKLAGRFVRRLDIPVRRVCCRLRFIRVANSMVTDRNVHRTISSAHQRALQGQPCFSFLTVQSMSCAHSCAFHRTGTMPNCVSPVRTPKLGKQTGIACVGATQLRKASSPITQPSSPMPARASAGWPTPQPHAPSPQRSTNSSGENK